MISARRRALLVAGASLPMIALASCSEGSSAPADEAGMHITLPDQELSLAAGTSGTVRVIIVRNGYQGQLTLRTENVPSGVTVPDVFVTQDEDEGALIFTASSGATPGTSDVTIRAEGDSVETSLRTLRLSITPPGSFFITADVIAMTPGTSASTNVTLNRVGGFNGTVALTASAPPGLVASLQPAELSGTASNSLLTIFADRTLRPGAYFVRVTGTSPGFADESLEITITVSGS